MTDLLPFCKETEFKKKKKDTVEVLQLLLIWNWLDRTGWVFLIQVSDLASVNKYHTEKIHKQYIKSTTSNGTSYRVVLVKCQSN